MNFGEQIQKMPSVKNMIKPIFTWRAWPEKNDKNLLLLVGFL